MRMKWVFQRMREKGRGRDRQGKSCLPKEKERQLLKLNEGLIRVIGE